MKQANWKWVFVCAGMLGLAALARPAMAAGVPSKTTQTCSDQVQNNTLKYINAVQKQIRLSIKNNMKGKDSKCSGGFACAGGANHGKTCTLNSECPDGQCRANIAKGVSGAINKAKGTLRSKYDKFCTPADLATLGFPNSRCPEATSASTLADCVLQAAIGDIANAVFGDAAGEVMGRAAGNLVPQGPAPNQVCGVILGSILQIGSESADPTLIEAGGAQPLDLDCSVSPCTTSGQGPIGNDLDAPTQTFAGLIPICLVTVTVNAGNGTPQAGTIDLATGQQTALAPISSTVLIAAVCPICDALVGLCDGGANSGLPCNNRGTTDASCPPDMAPAPVIPISLDFDTEPNSLSVPANNPSGGATNPAGTFCGACDIDETVGCNNDQACVDADACSGDVGSGCCQFGTNTGAFGVDNATTAFANGVRGPYVPKLAAIFCVGKSGSSLVDGTQGLPGPARLVQQQLNAFQYAP